jgi:hypothetical protein
LADLGQSIPSLETGCGMIKQFPRNKISFTVRDNDIKVEIDSRDKTEPLITLIFTMEDALKVHAALGGAINELENSNEKRV